MTDANAETKPKPGPGQDKLPGTDPDPAPTGSTPSGDAKPKPGKTRTRSRKAAAASKAAAPTPSRRKSTPKGGRPSRSQFDAMCADLIDRLIGLLTIAGIASPAVAYDAQILDGRRDELVTELSERCWSNPRLRQFIETSATAGDWARTVSLILGVGVPIAANHGLLPPATAPLLGAPLPPERKPKRTPDVADPDPDDPITERTGWPTVAPADGPLDLGGRATAP